MSNEKEQLIDIMRKNRHSAFMANCVDGCPVIRPMSPVVDDDMTIWLVTFKGSKKVSQLVKNANICLEFAEAPSWKSEVTVFGSVEFATDLTVKQHVWNVASSDLRRYFPTGPDHPQFCLMKVLVDRIAYRTSYEDPVREYRPGNC